jgi:nucleoid DNA-binding protein
MNWQMLVHRIALELPNWVSGWERVDADVESETIKNSEIMTLTKRDIVISIAEKTGLTQTQVFDVVQYTLDNIVNALADGGKVELRNFGIFEVKIRKARVGRNPHKPETDVPIPARAMVKFKAGKGMRAEVLKLPPIPAN